MNAKHTVGSLDLPVLAEGEQVSRADLVFYEVDHSGPSYEARVFVNNSEADENTPRDMEHGYAGYYTVFGHNRCYGDEGHCLPERMQRDEFDHRLRHPLTPWTKTVIATEAVKRAIEDTEVSEIEVTVVAAAPDDEIVPPTGEPLQFGSVRLLVYQDESL